MTTIAAPTVNDPEELNGTRACALLVFGVLITLWQAYVFVHLWNWFAVPLGVKSLAFRNGLGLLFLVGFLQYNHRDDKQKGYLYLKKMIGRGFSSANIFLLLGWLLHWFV